MKTKYIVILNVCLFFGCSHPGLGPIRSLAQDFPNLQFGPPSYSATMIPSATQLAAATYSDSNEKQLLSHYRTGWEYCQAFPEIATEKSFWVDVPIDYKDPNRGTIPIFAYFRDDYSANRPTVLIFDGGPGSNTHSSELYPRMSTSFNELHFDQRGIACSRPPTLDLYKDPSFYSFENTIQDADLVRNRLGLEQISVYGDSGGSILATMYANRYSQYTRAAALEGVYYSSNLSQDHGRTRAHLKQVWNSLSADTQQAMLSFFDTAKEEWIYSFAQNLTYSAPGIYSVLKQYLSSTFPNPETIGDTSEFDPAQSQAAIFSDTLDGIDRVSFDVLQCKQMRQFEREVPMFYRKSNGKAVILKNQRIDIGTALGIKPDCKSLGINWKEEYRTYSADSYPVSAPVTYFQGTWDTATDMDGAKRHWETVPRGEKQILLAQHGSHLCNVMAFDPRFSSPASISAQKLIFDKALQGELATQADVDGMNNQDSAHANQPWSVKWVLNSWNTGNDSP